MVGQLVALGRVQLAEVIEDEGWAPFRDVAACHDPDGRGPRLFFQKVPKPKQVKNRVHLDLHVGPDRRDVEVARLTTLRATHAWTTSDRGPICITMRDPEGNEFCVE